MSFPTVRVTFPMKARSKTRSSRIGSLKGSFMEGARNVYGFLGEEVFRKVCPEAIPTDTYDHDFLVGRQKVDVKTRTGSKPPEDGFDIVLPLLKGQDQDVDFYVFIQVAKDKSKAWVLGYLSKMELWRLAKFVRKGDPMPQGGRFKCTGYMIYVGDLHEWEAL